MLMEERTEGVIGRMEKMYSIDNSLYMNYMVGKVRIILNTFEKYSHLISVGTSKVVIQKYST